MITFVCVLHELKHFFSSLKKGKHFLFVLSFATDQECYLLLASPHGAVRRLGGWVGGHPCWGLQAFVTSRHLGFSRLKRLPFISLMRGLDCDKNVGWKNRCFAASIIAHIFRSFFSPDWRFPCITHHNATGIP